MNFYESPIQLACLLFVALVQTIFNKIIHAFTSFIRQTQNPHSIHIGSYPFLSFCLSFLLSDSSELSRFLLSLFIIFCFYILYPVVISDHLFVLPMNPLLLKFALECIQMPVFSTSQLTSSYHFCLSCFLSSSDPPILLNSHSPNFIHSTFNILSSVLRLYFFPEHFIKSLVQNMQKKDQNKIINSVNVRGTENPRLKFATKLERYIYICLHINRYVTG